MPGRTLGPPIRPERAVDVDEEIDLLVAEALLAARPVRPVPLGGSDASARARPS